MFQHVRWPRSGRLAKILLQPGVKALSIIGKNAWAGMNLKDLSQYLRLSQTTVSRALAGYSDVAESTRERVREEARRLGYAPNAAAQRLALGKARAIGLVFATAHSTPADPLFTEFLTGLSERAARADTDVLISAATMQPGDDLRVYRRLAQVKSVDAIVLSSPQLEDQRVPLLLKLGIPTVLHGRTVSRASTAYLDIDNEGAFRRSTELLIDLGHKRIALINGDPRFTFAHHRQIGWQEAHQAAGLAAAPDILSSGPMTDEYGYRATKALISMAHRPTAIICSSLISALGCCRALRDAGLQVGPDVSVIAHDDGLQAIKPETLSPPLTTTTSPIRNHGTRVAEMALALVAGEDPANLQEVWPVDLVFRGSTQRARES
jgi:LacI family transcriptional regulator